MPDLERRARKLVQGWPSGGLVVGLLPDGSHRDWSGKASLELATVAASDRLAALVLDLAPDDSDLADRFGADPEPGFAQVMTGEVELSTIQHWDPVRGAYYLPGGVRVLSDKVAKSRSAEALAERVRGQEGILFVLLDQHAAEAAAEAGWLDGVVRLGDADLGGPKMFADVTAMGRLERRETAGKPWEPEEEEERETPDEPATPEVPGEPGEAEVTTAPATMEVSEEAWEPRDTVGTEVLDRPGDVEDEAETEAEADVRDAIGDAPVLELSAEMWEPAEARGETGVTEEPEIEETSEVSGDEQPAGPEVAEDEDVPAEEVSAPEVGEDGEVEADDDAGADVAAEPEVDEAPEEESEAETGDAHEVRPGERPSGAEVEETPEEAARPQTAESAEVETEEQPAEPEVAGDPESEATEEAGAAAEVDTEAEPARTEISGEPELSGTPGEAEAEVGAGRETSESAEAQGSGEVETPDETPEPEIEEPAADEIDRPAGLERFAEIPEDSAETEPAREVDGDGEDEEDEEDDEPEPAPVHADVISSGLEVWPDDAGEPAAPGEAQDVTPAADGAGREPAASVISASPWARPEENGGSEEPEDSETEDFITAAMWVSGDTGTEETASAGPKDSGAAVISGGRWAPAAEAAAGADVQAPDQAQEESADPAAPAETEESDDAQESGQPQRADFILDGLELPPEWSDEWEEEERAAAGTTGDGATEDEGAADETGDDEPSDGAGEEGNADFVTQGMGIPDDEEEHDDPWPDSGASTDWSRDSGSGSESWERDASSPSSGTWERDPYGSSTGRAAAATAGAPERQGLALARHGGGGGELWRKARTAAIAVLTVGSVGVFGSAVVDSGALSAIGHAAATAVSGLGDGTSGADGGSGEMAAAGPAGGGAGAAGADSAASPPEESSAEASDSEGPSRADGDGEEAVATPLVSDGTDFYAVTDSLRRSIEEYSDQMDLHREGTIGCPPLMSAREETGRLFVRLSMFRLSEGARPDSVFDTAYRRFSEDMEWVEDSYSQTECPRPSTARRPSSAAGPTARETAASDSPGPAAPAEPVESDSAAPRGDSVPRDSAADPLPAGEAVDPTPPDTIPPAGAAGPDTAAGAPSV